MAIDVAGERHETRPHIDQDALGFALQRLSRPAQKMTAQPRIGVPRRTGVILWTECRSGYVRRRCDGAHTTGRFDAIHEGASMGGVPAADAAARVPRRGERAASHRRRRSAPLPWAKRVRAHHDAAPRFRHRPLGRNAPRHETDRTDALFDDPWAVRLAGRRGRELVAEIPQASSIAWSMSVRTAVIDSPVLDCVARGSRTVVNLGAGLDMRAFRLQLPPSLVWLDVDLPEVIAHRHETLQNVSARCRHRDVEADLATDCGQSTVMAALGDGRGPVVVLTGGLLNYLEPVTVAALVRRLLSEQRVQWWVTDLVAPALTASLGSQWVLLLRDASADFRFAPEDGPAFFAEASWREESLRPTLEEGLRFQRPPPLMASWNPMALTGWRTLSSKRRRLSGIALLGRSDADAPSTAAARSHVRQAQS